MKAVKITAPWWAWLLLLMGLLLFTKLGIWQWHRSLEKIEILKQMELQSSQYSSYLAGELNPKTIKQFQKVELAGHFDEQRIFLLDNRFYQHRFGFDVLVLYKLPDDKYVIVDRGWVASGTDRRQPSQIKPIVAESSIKGRVYYPSDKSWVLGSQTETTQQGNIILEKVDFQHIEKLLNIQLYPFILRLNKNDPNALVRDWRVITMQPSQHKGYAFQWFGMAITALIIFLVLNTERNNRAIK